MNKAVAILLTLFSSSIAIAQRPLDELYTPARFLSGKSPEQPPLAAEGGVTVLEVHVAPSGIVTDAVVLDEASPYTETIRQVTTLWRFRPAEEDGAAIASRVLVVGVFRPPVLMGTALAEPTSVRLPSEAVPYPMGPMPVPEYPPNALFEGVAMVEVEIDDAGDVVVAKMLSPERGFDETALDAARRFRFRPARHEGRPVPSFALIFFGFRQPLTTPGLPRR
jgi:TonB family protein